MLRQRDVEEWAHVGTWFVDLFDQKHVFFANMSLQKL